MARFAGRVPRTPPYRTQPESKYGPFPHGRREGDPRDRTDVHPRGTLPLDELLLPLEKVGPIEDGVPHRERSHHLGLIIARDLLRGYPKIGGNLI